jgi:glucosamine 6-phosphate synthetase-like amidotransferase/phosphosugar isomerase protein
MCGICGVYKLSIRDSDDLSVDDQNNYAETIFHNLLLDMEDRGKDATGYACITRGRVGGEDDVFVQKLNVKASEFIKTKKFRKLEWALPKSRCVIGHCRARTKGSENDNRNNHPLWSKETGKIIVHNGIINNDDRIKEKENFKTDGEVDSEVILRLLEKYDVKGASERLYGSFAVAMIDLVSPDNLLLFRHTNPLFVGYIKEYRLIVFASTEDAVLSCCYGGETFTKLLGFFKIVNKSDVPDIICQELDNDSWLSINPSDDFVGGVFDASSNVDYQSYNSTVYVSNGYCGSRNDCSGRVDKGNGKIMRGIARPLQDGDGGYFLGALSVEDKSYVHRFNIVGRLHKEYGQQPLSDATFPTTPKQQRCIERDGASVNINNFDMYDFLNSQVECHDGIMYFDGGMQRITFDMEYYGM